jgi:23S rRNA pseudouridine2605 synthase
MSGTLSSLVTSCNLVTGATHHLLLTTHHFNQLLTKKEYLRRMKKTGRSSAGRTGSSSKSGRKGSFSKTSGGKSGGKRAYGASSGSEKPRFSRSADGPGERGGSRSDSRGTDRPKRTSFGDEAPKRPYNRGEGSTGRPKTSRSFDEKPKRTYAPRDENRSASEDGPKRPYNRGEGSSERPRSSGYGDGPKRPSRIGSTERSRSTEDSQKRPYNRGGGTGFRGKSSRSFDDKPKWDVDPSEDRRILGDDAPKRTYNKRIIDGDRPKTSRSFDEKPKRSYSDRADSSSREEKRSSSSDERPKRAYDKGEYKPFSRDDKRPRRSSDDTAPKRNFNRGAGSDDRRPSFGRDITPDAERPARKAFNDDAPKSEFDRSKRRSSSTGTRDAGGRGGARGERPAGRSSAGARGGSFDKKPSFRGKKDEGEFGATKWNRKESTGFYGEKKKASPARPKADEDGSTRLNKFIANAGICSRREADEMIEAGVISINGKVVTEMGYKVLPGDEVKYNGETLRGESMVYILLNKPKDFITTTEDPDDRKTVMGLIAKACKERVYPVGRLDRNTTGVLLFTNDGDLARKLTHPSFQMEKVYQVELDKNLKTVDMEQITAGLKLEDGPIKVDNILYAGNGEERNVVGVELHSGKNRIVRRIFEHLGYEVKKLDRVIFAGLTKKDLPRGRWRFLTDMEVASLKMMTSKVKK